MLEITVILKLLSHIGFTPVQTCNSTIFGYHGDKWAGGNALYLKRPIEDDDVGIAHRGFPMGAVIAIENLRTGQMAVGMVVDRGPYGALHKGKWVLKRKKKNRGKWRGCADLTPAMAEAIGHDGFERVRVWRLRKPLRPTLGDLYRKMAREKELRQEAVYTTQKPFFVQAPDSIINGMVADNW